MLVNAGKTRLSRSMYVKVKVATRFYELHKMYAKIQKMQIYTER